MKRLLKYMRQRAVESILAPLFKMLEALFELFVPIIVADMIDRGISGEGGGGVIIRGGLLLLTLGLVGFVSSITAQYFAARAAIGTSTQLRHHLMGHIQSLSHTELDKRFRRIQS